MTDLILELRNYVYVCGGKKDIRGREARLGEGWICIQFGAC